MEVNELMVGNVVWYINPNQTTPNGVVVISKITKNGHLGLEDVTTEYPLITDIQGCNINDEVLTALGFEKYDDVFSFAEFDVIKENNCYYLCGTKVLYVHEIQNILKVMFNYKLTINVQKLQELYDKGNH